MLGFLQTKAKATSDNAARMLDAVKQELETRIEGIADAVHAITANVQLNTIAREEARTAVKEAVEVGRANLQMAKQIKKARPQTGSAVSYANMEVRDASGYSKYSSP